MTYTLVGTGNMAWFLSKNLQATGSRCMGVFGRNKTEATTLAAALNAPILHQLFHIREGMANCCIIAVADSAVAEVAAKIPLTETVMIHTSGSLALDVIPSYNSAALWCIYSIVKNNFPLHRNIPVICEAGTTKAFETVKNIAATFTDIIQQASWHQRQYLHLAAVMSNNFINHLLAVSSEICIENNIPFELLNPIIEQTFQRIQNTNPKETQTGPAKRGDKNTLQRHLLLLQQHPEWQQLYKSISDSIENMYKLPEKKNN